MSAAAINPHSRKSLLGLMTFGLAVVTLVGVALTVRGPDPAYLPEMVTQPVVMPDGRRFFPQHFEVTVAEWNRCAKDSDCQITLRTRPDQDPATTPATGLSFIDVQHYVGWINRKTHHHFRLPTAEEWGVMAAKVLPEDPDPLFSDPALAWAADYLIGGSAPRALRPQGSFSTSPEGVADLDGSVWEWTMECYDGSTEEADLDQCPAFFVGGEHIATMPFLVRDPANGGCAVGSPPAHLGMRLISDEPV